MKSRKLKILNWIFFTAIAGLVLMVLAGEKFSPGFPDIDSNPTFAASVFLMVSVALGSINAINFLEGALKLAKIRIKRENHPILFYVVLFFQSLGAVFFLGLAIYTLMGGGGSS